MIKTAVVSNNDPREFVNMLNDVIKDKKVIDIKYQSYHFISSYNLNGTPDEVDFVDRALVIYEAGDETPNDIPEETADACN